ncbi:TPA: hypothetical protein ACY382_000083 [Pasteurella multocida]|uniref:hypothetical protein n=1 Tax=Pasteurella multocida TaxID=747 RepID=UPI0039797D88
MKFDMKNREVDIIECAGVSLPKELGTELFKQAKSFITQYVKIGQSLSHLINTLQDHNISFERAPETEDNSVLPQELQFRNYWYQFSDRTQDIALLQCVVRTVTTSEYH